MNEREIKQHKEFERALGLGSGATIEEFWDAEHDSPELLRLLIQSEIQLLSGSSKTRQGFPIYAKRFPSFVPYILQAFINLGEEVALGRCVLSKKIGEGGMGAVFLARQESVGGRTVAVKILPPTTMLDQSAVVRFTREVTALSKLEHDNVVTVHEHSHSYGVTALVMQYVDGGDLADMVLHGGPLRPSLAIDYICQAAAGLGAAHRKGVVHRDVKPSNLLFDKNKERVKVGDFGLAKPDQDSSHPFNLTKTSQVMGTPGYMPPEQASSALKADKRSDIYSLGCTFYFLLTGRKPGIGAHLDDVRFDEVFQKMVAESPEDRFQSMEQVSQALSKLLEVKSTITLPAPTPKQKGHVPKQLLRWLGVPLAGFVMLALAFGSRAFDLSTGPESSQASTNGSSYRTDSMPTNQTEHRIPKNSIEKELEPAKSPAAAEHANVERDDSSAHIVEALPKDQAIGVGASSSELSAAGEIGELGDDPRRFRPQDGQPDEIAVRETSSTVPSQDIERVRNSLSSGVLALYEQRFDERALQYLPQGANIVEANLGNTGVSNEALRHLSRFQSIRRLILYRNPRIDDRGLKHITKLRSLSVLNLEGTNVSDHGVESLLQMEGLQLLHLSGTRVSRETKIKLQNQVVGLKVL